MALRRFSKAWFEARRASYIERATERPREIAQLAAIRRRTAQQRSQLAALRSSERARQRIEHRKEIRKVPEALIREHFRTHHIYDGATGTKGHVTDAGYLRQFIAEHPAGARMLLEEAAANYRKKREGRTDFIFSDPFDYDDDFPDDWKEDVPELGYYH